MERAELIALLRSGGHVVERAGCVFLRDPHWSVAENAAAEALIAQADAVPSDEGWLCIRTGGSGGGLKFARHDERTLSAAVAGFCEHFRLKQVNAVGALPPWHVSGLMARVRCAATGGTYVACDWKALENGALPVLADDRAWVISLVPTQLQRLLSAAPAVAWLRRFAVVFLGGGPVWSELADAAARAALPISLSYGMTETAAMVTAQQPSEFLAGDRSSGGAMPHATIDLDAEGRVRIRGQSLYRGYFPEWRTEREFVTEDLGRIDSSGRLQVLGRRDAMIITGGKKVQPLEVEAALRDSGEFEDVVVLGVPDQEWGESVVACYPAAAKAPNLEKAGAGLAGHQVPKAYVPIADWPRTAQGKINRVALAERVRRQLASTTRQKNG